MSTPTWRTVDPPRPKSTLFCPNCGHSSTVDEEWQYHSTTTSVAVDCPACGTTVTERPGSIGEADEDEPQSPLRTFQQLTLAPWVTWQDTLATCWRCGSAWNDTVEDLTP